MAKQAPENAEAAKMKRLRELREADEARRRAQGIWGSYSVAEISHPASNSVFLLRCRGREAPDLAKEARTRSSLVPPSDHQAFLDWIARRPYAEFRSRLIAWNLSEAESRRIQKSRVEEARASGFTVVNPASVAATH